MNIPDYAIATPKIKVTQENVNTISVNNTNMMMMMETCRPPALLYYPQRGTSADSGEPQPGNQGQTTTTTTTARKTGRKCQVCAEEASGNFFGALVCLPCKTFYIRCSGEDVQTFKCRHIGTCDVTGSQRSRCKACRYRNCLKAGMVRRERPEQVEATDGQQLCVVCGDIANGIHFGITSCEGCKKFFRRGLQEYETYSCKYSQVCPINPKTRNDCRYCRYQKCIHVGMSRGAIKMGRPKKSEQLLPYQVLNLPLYRQNQQTLSLAGPDVWTLRQQQQQQQHLSFPGRNKPQHQMPSPMLGSWGHQLGPTRVPTSPLGYHPYKPFGSCSPPRIQMQDRLNVMIPPLSYRTDSQTTTRTIADVQMTDHTKPRNGIDHDRDHDHDHDRRGKAENTNVRVAIKEETTEMECDRSSSTSSGYCSDMDAENNPNIPVDYSTKNSVNSIPPQQLKYRTKHESDLSCLLSKPKTTSAVLKESQISQQTVVKVDKYGCPPSGQNYSDAPLSPEKPSLLSEPATESSTPNNRSSQNSRILEYRFPAKFWLRPSVPDSPKPVPEDRMRINALLTAYEKLVAGFCQPEDELAETESCSDEGVLTKRIMHHTRLTMSFIQSIPGFSSAAATADKFTIFRLSGIQLSILVAASNLYDSETNSFIRNFYEKPLQSRNPLFSFRHSLLDFAAQLQTLKLDAVEIAFLVALVAIATDWPDLKEPAALDSVFRETLGTLHSYIIEMYGPASQRLNNIFGYVPRLRQLGQWHYDLTLRDILAHY